METPFPHFGESMALLAAMIFSWTSIFFTSAGQRLGVTTVNLLRLPTGALCLAVCHLILFGRIWPENLALVDHFWIGLSGVVGLAIGDSALFKAFTMIGPRRSMTMMALAPVFTVVLAWILLDEHLSIWAITGIVVIIAGVIIASQGKADKKGRFGTIDSRVLKIGLLLGLVASAGQGLGSIFVKMGLTGSEVNGADLSPLSATLVRIVWAAVCYWIVVLPRQNVREIAGRLRDRKGVIALAIAIITGPFISVWISLVAIKYTEAGIAQVLLGMVPVFVVIPAWFVYRDKPTVLSMLGVIIAVGGGTLLFLR